jgi:hypothetical protein
MKMSSPAIVKILALSFGASWAVGWPGAAQPPQPVTQGAVVVNNFDPALENAFSFQRTIGQILTSAGIANTAPARTAFVNTLIATFNSNQFINPVSGLPMPVDVRPGDAGLSAAQLLAPGGMIPIGLFNRLDLAPANWSDCGEHRIVYARPASAPSRFFLIFEAKLPNPQPGLGMLGCRPVAQRWAAIGGITTAAARRAMLEQFYYTGLAGFRAVVDYRNYGSFLGQVRSNSFVDVPTWQLREFRVLPVAPQTLAFRPGPDASNPLVELYRNNPQGSPQLIALRSQFHSQFGALNVPNLRQVDQNSPAAMPQAIFVRNLLNMMGAGFDFRFNEFQSNASGPAVDNPATHIQSQVNALIPANWTNLNRSVSRAQMINRAGAMTCAGCHQFSNGADIGTVAGQTIRWPSSGRFVHVSEVNTSTGHLLSSALRNVFIPWRQRATNIVLGIPQVRWQGRQGAERSAAAAPQDARSRAGYRLSPRRSALVSFQPDAQAGPAVRPAAQTESAMATTRRREEIEGLARRVLSERDGRAAAELQRAAAEAQAEDQRQPGAFTPFRRPH